MKYPVYNLEGKEDGSITLPKEIFEIKFNADLVHQVAVSLMANKRQISAHTKNRGEVRGGGKKPWRQKGTGRARHGSTRSPIWKGGGITFGPRNEKVYEVEIPRKLRRKALFMTLSQKAEKGTLLVMDGSLFAEAFTDKPKTKRMAEILGKMPSKGQTTLIALPNYDKKIFLSARNIGKTLIDDARNLNVLSLLNSKYLLITEDTVKTIKDTFIK